jgi:nitric oxide reductase subunit C
MKFKARHTFFILSVLFLVYTVSIYLEPYQLKDNDTNTKNVINGRLVWQKYNCQSCHQLYGLGGYLGPDLTNLMSQQNKGEPLLKAMIKSGNKQMPAFNLSDLEMEELISFLKAADNSGNADPRKFKSNSFGMIEIK